MKLKRIPLLMSALLVLSGAEAGFAAIGAKAKPKPSDFSSKLRQIKIGEFGQGLEVRIKSKTAQFGFVVSPEYRVDGASSKTRINVLPRKTDGSIMRFSTMKPLELPEAEEGKPAGKSVEKAASPGSADSSGFLTVEAQAVETVDEDEAKRFRDAALALAAKRFGGARAVEEREINRAGIPGVEFKLQRGEKVTFVGYLPYPGGMFEYALSGAANTIETRRADLEALLLTLRFAADGESLPTPKFDGAL